MKKRSLILALVSILVFLCTVNPYINIAFADTFTIRNGIHSDSNKEDIIAIEASNNVSLSIADDGSLEGIAELPYLGSAKLRYKFDESDNLSSIYYWNITQYKSSIDSYHSLCTALTQKYGLPYASGFADESIQRPQFMNAEAYRDLLFGANTDLFSSWIVIFDDCALAIDTIYYEYNEQLFREESETELFYTILPLDYVMSFMQKEQQLIDSL